MHAVLSPHPKASHSVLSVDLVLRDSVEVVTLAALVCLMCSQVLQMSLNILYIELKLIAYMVGWFESVNIMRQNNLEG